MTGITEYGEIAINPTITEWGERLNASSLTETGARAFGFGGGTAYQTTVTDLLSFYEAKTTKPKVNNSDKLGLLRHKNVQI